MPKFDVTLDGRATPTTIEADSFYRRDHWVDFTVFEDGKGVTVASIPEHQVASILRRPESKPADTGTVNVTLVAAYDAAIKKAIADARAALGIVF